MYIISYGHRDLLWGGDDFDSLLAQIVYGVPLETQAPVKQESFRGRLGMVYPGR